MPFAGNVVEWRGGGLALQFDLHPARRGGTSPPECRDTRVGCAGDYLCHCEPT